MYLNTIIWKEMLNVDLNEINELQTLCSAFLEWRHVPYVIAFQLFFASFFFRYDELWIKYYIALAANFSFCVLLQRGSTLVVYEGI